MSMPKIWLYDQYSFRKFYPDKIDCFLDIGAYIGAASVFFKSICPRAIVVAIEPCRENYEIMKVAAGTWDVQCYNMALGNGEKLCFDRRTRVGHRFYTETEKSWWPKNPEYFVDSKTLPELFNHFKITGKYVIKVDAEGGERFILDNKDCIDIVRNSIQFNIELHRGFGGKSECWQEWFKNFTGTHDLLRCTKIPKANVFLFEPSIGPKGTHRDEFMLIRRGYGAKTLVV